MEQFFLQPSTMTSLTLDPRFEVARTGIFSVVVPKGVNPNKNLKLSVAASKAPAAAPASKEAPKKEAPKPKEAPKKEEEEEDDDDDLFGDDDDEPDEAAAAAAKKAAEARAAAAKKTQKPKPVERSQLVIEIKPWEAETDLLELAKKIREVEIDGLVWGEGQKLAPVAFGIKKLVMSCVIVDDKVGLDDVTDAIEQFEDYVQSVDLASMNKV